MLKTQAIGRVGKDATAKEINGRFVINFSVAVNERTVNPTTGEVMQDTTWLSCAMWRDNMGKVWEYLKKGQQVYVEGKPSYRIYKKSDNRPGLDVTLKVERVELLGSSGNGNTTGQSDDTDFEWDDDTNGSNNAASAEQDDDEEFWKNPPVTEASSLKEKEEEKNSPSDGNIVAELMKDAVPLSGSSQQVGKKIMDGIEVPFD